MRKGAGLPGRHRESGMQVQFLPGLTFFDIIITMRRNTFSKATSWPGVYPAFWATKRPLNAKLKPTLFSTFLGLSMSGALGYALRDELKNGGITRKLLWGIPILLPGITTSLIAAHVQAVNKAAKKLFMNLPESEQRKLLLHALARVKANFLFPKKDSPKIREYVKQLSGLSNEELINQYRQTVALRRIVPLLALGVAGRMLH